MRSHRKNFAKSGALKARLRLLERSGGGDGFDLGAIMIRCFHLLAVTGFARLMGAWSLALVGFSLVCLGVDVGARVACDIGKVRPGVGLVCSYCRRLRARAVLGTSRAERARAIGMN